MEVFLNGKIANYGKEEAEAEEIKERIMLLWNK